MAQNECYNIMYAVKKVLNIFANVKSNSNPGGRQQNRKEMMIFANVKFNSNLIIKK